MSPALLTEHVTCLGCGLACDDIAVTVTDGRITEARNACSLGVRWFGDGIVPIIARVGGVDASRDMALREAATVLRGARRPLVYLAPELSTASQRTAVALADVLHATLDTVTTATAGDMIVAAQQRGRCGATFGEVLNRADTIVFWGVDPHESYPRLRSRYIADGRLTRTTISVDIGSHNGPSDVDYHAKFSTAEDVACIALTRAAVLRPPKSASSVHETLAARLVAGKYVVLIVEGEMRSGRDPGRAEGLLALAEALNGPTRCALVTLRAGGNRFGAESVLTWQTGYPMAVDFARGTPRYVPNRPLIGDADVVMVIGAVAGTPIEVQAAARIVIGPRASACKAPITIDTGIAGIHDGGTAVRCDDIPLPLRPPLAGAAPDTLTTLQDLLALVAAR